MADEDNKIFRLVPQQAALPVEFDDPVATVFEFWKALLGHPRAQLGPGRRKAIKTALLIGYSVDDLRLACVGCKFSDFHQGANRDATTYDDIELIVRNEAHIERFMRLGEEKLRAAIQKERAAKEATDNPAVPMPPEIRAKLDALFTSLKRPR